PPRSSPTTAPLHPRAASVRRIEISPAARLSISPQQSTRRGRSPPEGIHATPPRQPQKLPSSSAQTKRHPQTQTRNPAPQPDISPAARTAPAAVRACTAAPDRTPPEIHPAAACAPQRPRDEPARTVPPPRHSLAPAPNVRDENNRPSPGHNSHHPRTPPEDSPRHP